MHMISEERSQMENTDAVLKCTVCLIQYKTRYQMACGRETFTNLICSTDKALTRLC